VGLLLKYSTVAQTVITFVATYLHIQQARIFPLHPAIVFVVVVVIPVSATEFQVRIAFCFCRICGFVVLSDGVKWSGSPENGEGNW